MLGKSEFADTGLWKSGQMVEYFKIYKELHIPKVD
jgi:hypothetical protein